jgi:hypothetical protein
MKIKTFKRLVWLLTALLIGCNKPPVVVANPHQKMIEQLAAIEAAVETGTTQEKFNQQLIDFRTERKLRPAGHYNDGLANLVESECETLLMLSQSRSDSLLRYGEDPAKVTEGRRAYVYEAWRSLHASSVDGLKDFSAQLRASLLTNNIK